MPTLEYTFSIQDQASDTLQRITAASQPLISAVTTVQDKMASASALMNETGGSITALKAQIDALSAERDLLPADGLGTIAQYNERIGELQQKVTDLQTKKPKPVSVPYTFTLNDRVSGGLRKINRESEHVRSAMDGVGQKMKAADALMDATGRSVGALRAKIEALRAQREWIPSDNLDAIREYDKEIKSLGDEIERVERLTSGQSNLSKWAGDIASSIPGIGLLKNPIVQTGTAIVGTAKSAMTFDQNMAQVNITTQFEGEELENLRKGIKGVADEFGADAATVPLAFDLINSQLNEAKVSMNVLQASIKGSKAGFTDVNTVASALAQTVSLLGDVDANNVLDVFFASKRTGAVDFSSLAQYLPKLLSTGVGMGIDYKDVAGSFAYLTGKGQSAEQATVMLQNAMSMLGKGDVRDKMAKAGVKVFDEQGKMRGMTDIFGDLNSLMSGRSDEERSQILEAFGIVDKEAKGGFNVLMADMEKYKKIIGEVNDATKNAEGDKALRYSKNTVQEAEEAWNRFKNVGLSIGEQMLPTISTGLETFSTLIQALSPAVQLVAPVIDGAFSGVSAVLKGVTFVVRTLIDFFGGWLSYLQEGQPVVVGFTAALAALGVVWAANTAIAKADIVWQGIKNGLTVVSTTLTEGWAAAQALLNAAFLACPLAWVIAAIVAVVAAVAAAWQKFEGFRVAVLGAWGVVKEFGRSLVSAIISPIKQILKGIGSLGEAFQNLFDGNFDAAAAAAKQGFKDIGNGVLQTSPAGVVANTWKNGDYAQAWEKGKQAGHESWSKSQHEKQVENATNVPNAQGDASRTIEEIQKAINGKSTKDLLKDLDNNKSGRGGKSGKGSKTKQTLDLNEEATNYAQSANYLAATQKLAPITARLLPIGDVAQTQSINGGIAKTQALTQTNSALKVDVAQQEYEPEGTNYLSDIMANVRKIAAAVMLPMAVSLTSPAEASATTNILSQSKTQNVSASSMTVQSDALSLSSTGKKSVIDLSKPYEVTLPEIVITPGSNSTELAQNIGSASLMGGTLTEPMDQSETLNAAGDIAIQSVENRSEANGQRNFWNLQGGSLTWMPSFMSSSSSASRLSDALTLSDSNSQTLGNAVAVNGSQVMPEPYEVTLPEIVVTPGSNSTELAQNIGSASLMGGTLTEPMDQSETLNAAGDIAIQSVENRSEANGQRNFWNMQGGSSTWMPSFMSSSSSAISLSDALTLSDSNSQAFGNAVSVNGSQAMPEPYEVTLPEIVVTHSSNNTKLAQNIGSASLMGDTLMSASSTGDTISEASAQSEAVNISNAVPELTNAREKAEPKRKGIRGWLANKFQPLLASVGGTSAELHNPTGGDTMRSVNAASDTLSLSMGNYADNSISMPSMSESLSDATDIANTDNSQSQTLNSSVQESSGNGSRNVTIDRVCDQIVINVENTDGQGAEEIRSHILEVLNEIVEG